MWGRRCLFAQVAEDGLKKDLIRIGKGLWIYPQYPPYTLFTTATSSHAHYSVHNIEEVENDIKHLLVLRNWIKDNDHTV